MITRLAIWYLRKRKVSVLINMKVKDGTVQQKTNKSYVYDNHLGNIRYLNKNGKELSIPKGKFQIEYNELPNQFSFVIPLNEKGLLYTATRLNDEQFTISWGTTSSVVFEESSIQRSLKDGSYIIKD